MIKYKCESSFKEKEEDEKKHVCCSTFSSRACHSPGGHRRWPGGDLVERMGFTRVYVEQRI